MASVGGWTVNRQKVGWESEGRCSDVGWWAFGRTENRMRDRFRITMGYKTPASYFDIVSDICNVPRPRELTVTVYYLQWHEMDSRSQWGRKRYTNIWRSWKLTLSTLEVFSICRVTVGPSRLTCASYYRTLINRTILTNETEGETSMSISNSLKQY